ncbi:hypothetical protein MSIBF_A610001 [groundwater metagenome]|uniref:Uncharacterized protein n=1 Tax=groundwater metagenome TaxID=717931 RepID=A0A098EED2_9ZZZZ
MIKNIFLAHSLKKWSIKGNWGRKPWWGFTSIELMVMVKM